jgi:hypothetical protein
MNETALAARTGCSESVNSCVPRLYTVAYELGTKKSGWAELRFISRQEHHHINTASVTIHLLSRFRTCGILPPLSLYAFMVWC